MVEEADFCYIIGKYKDKFEKSQDVNDAREIIPEKLKKDGFIKDEFNSLNTSGKIVNHCDILKDYVKCYNFDNKNSNLLYIEDYVSNNNKLSKLCYIYYLNKKL
jgi:hypothetical protein